MKTWKKIIILLLILSSSLCAKEISYKDIIKKDYKSKDSLMEDMKELLTSLNKKHKQEVLSLKEPKVLVNITKMNYARVLHQFSNLILKHHFNTKQHNYFKSYWFTINHMNLKESLKYIKSNNPEIRLKNLQKGEYVEINFSNNSLKK